MLKTLARVMLKSAPRAASRLEAWHHAHSCAFLSCFLLVVSWGGPSTFLSRAWVYVSRIVGVIVCGCICVSTCILNFFLFYTYFGGPTTFYSLPYLLLHTYTLHIQSLCVQPARDPRRELCSPTQSSTLIVYGWWFTRSRAVLQQLYLVSVPVPKFRLCSHMRIFLVVWFTDDHGLCSCVRARVVPQLLYCIIYTCIYIHKLRLCSHLRIFLVVRFTDDRGICSCVHAHVMQQQLHYI